MRSFTIILFLAICAPIISVHCDSDSSDSSEDDGLFFLYWLMPSGYPAFERRSMSSYSDDESSYSTSTHSLSDEDVPKTQKVQDVYYDMLPTDVAYEAGQLPFEADEIPPAVSTIESVENEPKCEEELSSLETTEETLSTDSSKKSSSATRKQEQGFWDDEFMRQFMRFMEFPSSVSIEESQIEEESTKSDSTKSESTKKEPIEEKPIKKEPTEDKFNEKKFIGIDIKKIPQKNIQKSTESNLEWSDSEDNSSGDESFETQNSSTKCAETTKEEESEESSEEISTYDSSYDMSESDTTQSSEESTNKEDSDSQSSETVENSDISESSSSYEGPILVPLAPLPEDYEEPEYDNDYIEFINSLTPKPSTGNSIPRDETIEDKEEMISDVSQVDDIKEENVDDRISTAEDKKETAEMEPEIQEKEISTDNDVEKENEIPKTDNNDKPMGRLSIAKLFRAFLDAFPLV